MRSELCVLTAAVLLGFASSTAAATPDRHPPSSNLRKQLAGLRYPVARDKLIALGWTPAPSHGDVGSGSAGYFWSQGQTEIESCSEGEVVCAFLFKNAAGECLHVVTLGEAARAKVDHLDHRCFSAP